jgi:hypothetical protein
MMLKPKTKTNTDPMEEAYKLLDGEPAADAVSQAAQGNVPKTDMEAREDDHDMQTQRFMGGGIQDIDDAYAALFGALAFIIQHK